MPANSLHPYHPIIYVRGFAATQGEIEQTVADPYMGFNIGSTKARMAWTGDVKRFYFESPLVRLMSEHGYRDVFEDGEDLVASDRTDCVIPYRSIVIYRYYDEASEDFGTGKTPPIEQFAKGLGELILRLRDKICDMPKNKVDRDDFQVHLVAHSMGGLVCRAFLQNPDLGKTKEEKRVLAEARPLVNKLFTYATPHNGIDMRIVRNVPGWLTFGDANNFNRDRMAGYLGLPAKGDDVSIVKNFPPERIFNLVGTNPRDYTVAGGLSAWGAGDASDGLVRIENATTHGPDAKGNDVRSPRAFVHRSHSGYYGIVNSEEGYQNLTRFLFGTLRVDGKFDIDDITLPVEVQKALQAGKQVRASYQFEIAVSVRACQWQMTRREVREHSAIFRTYGELFPGKDGTKRLPDRAQSPHLFSVFLDPAKSVEKSGSVSFAFDLKVLVPDYEVDGLLFMKRHYEGGSIMQKRLLIEAFPDENEIGGWRIMYGYQDDNSNKPSIKADTRKLDDDDGITFEIPIAQTTDPGVKGKLHIEARPVA
jgi:pimeloyl-ACP methyl ester carboxylesterase